MQSDDDDAATRIHAPGGGSRANASDLLARMRERPPAAGGAPLTPPSAHAQPFDATMVAGPYGATPVAQPQPVIESTLYAAPPEAALHPGAPMAPQGYAPPQGYPPAQAYAPPGYSQPANHAPPVYAVAAPSSSRSGLLVGVLIAAVCLTCVLAGGVAWSLRGSPSSSSATSAATPAATAAPSEAPWRTESGPGWSISVPPTWRHPDDPNSDDTVSFRASDNELPIHVSLWAMSVPPTTTMVNVRQILTSRAAGSQDTVLATRDVVEGNVTWFEMEYRRTADTTVLRRINRATVVGSRLWEANATTEDATFDLMRPTFMRVFASLRLSP